jgi:hypothetical protein
VTTPTARSLSLIGSPESPSARARAKYPSGWSGLSATALRAAFSARIGTARKLPSDGLTDGEFPRMNCASMNIWYRFPPSGGEAGAGTARSIRAAAWNDGTYRDPTITSLYSSQASASSAAGGAGRRGLVKSDSHDRGGGTGAIGPAGSRSAAGPNASATGSTRSRSNAGRVAAGPARQPHTAVRPSRYHAAHRSSSAHIRRVASFARTRVVGVSPADTDTAT